MYTYKNVSYTINQIQEAAKKSNMSVEDYVEKIKADTQPKTDEKVEDADLLDPTTFQTDAAAGAGVVSQPMTASQAGVTELPSVNTSSELQDLDSTKPLSASEKRIATRKKRQQEKQDRLKAEAILATNVINDRIKNIPKEDIVAIQANDYFGPIKSRNDRTTVSKTVPGMMAPTVAFEPTFDSDESYTKYLKETLGNKYDQYLNYKETNKIVPLNSQNQSQLEGIYNEAETQAKDKVYNNSLFNVSENVQEYMVASPKFATGAESLEAQKFLIKEQKQSIDKNYENYEKAKKEWESQALPLNKEVKDLKAQIDRFTFYSGGASQEQADQYNELIQNFNTKIQQWEEKGFNELPAFVNSQAKLVNSQQEDYSKMLEDSRKALVDADLFEKNLKQDYSTSARVGRVFDEFFVQSGRNFLDLYSELYLKGAKKIGEFYQPLSFLTSPENSEKIDSLIQTIQKNNKNYNLSMASKRENIPTSPSIDDIGKDGLSVWDWTSIALQDNSATISTTFVPGLAQLKGATTLTKAIKTGKGVKDALQKQKALWLAGKRTVQGTFFVAETGGKYGELQTDEASREQEIKFLYSKLDNTEDIGDKTKIYNKIKELEEIEDYSLLQKAFTSFSAGTTATFLESISTLKMLEPAKGLAKQIGINAAKKELYKQPVRFSANLIGKTVAGLKSLPKNLTGEILEETATEISHNALDILVLGENKSMFEGINKDFLASTAVSSFGIMAPRSAGNIFNIVKSEFRTRGEIFKNQELARELIDLNEATTPENSTQLRTRKKEILKELALSDAISLHKLRYMTANQIEEVADINRQMRQVNSKFTQLGGLGDLGEAENKRVKKQLEKEYSNLTIAKQEILDTKQRSNIKKAANINKALGNAARNSEAAFYYGVNNFYNDLTMTQMGDGDFISIKGEIQDDGKIKYNDLENQLAKYKNKTIKDEDGKNVDAFEYLKTKIEQGDFNATTIGKDIIVNQPIIDRNIAIAPTDTSAQYAAVAPLEELFHLSVSEKGIKFDSTAKNAVLEAEKVLKEKRDLGVISEKDYSGLKERFDLYRDGKDFDAEEFIAQMNNAISLGAINRSDLESTPSFKKFLNNAIRSTFGDMSWMLSLETSDDVFNLVKNFQADVSKGVTFQAPDREEVKTSLSQEASQASQEVQRIYDEQGVAGAFEILEKFKPITNKIVERRRDAPNFDRQLLTDEIETGKRGIFDLIKEYKPESGVPLAAYINKFLPARAIEASRRVLGEEFTDDVTEAKGVAAEEVAVSIKEEPTRKISPKKLKKYTGVVASNLGVSSSEVSNVIDKAIEADLKDKPIKTFGESRNIGDNLAKTLGKAFGLNPEVFTKKTRNIQKKELDGLRNLRQFLDNNAAKDFSLLPDAYAGPSTIEGKSTFIPNNILNALYRKNDKGKWEKDPTKTVQDYKDLLGKIEGNVYRAAEAQTIKGLAAMSFRNLIVEKAAETAEPKARVDIKAGAKFSKAQLLNVTQARDINSVAKILNIPKITVNDNNRVKKQKQMEEAIVASNIPSWMFEGSKFANFARRKINGIYVDLPAKGGLYYGSKDPAYKKALALAKQNDTDSDIKPPRRVNIKKAFTKEGQQQGQDNLKALEFFGNKLADAVAKGEIPIEIASLFVSSGYQATSGIIKVAAPFRYLSKNFKYGTIPKQMKGEKFREEHNPPASVIGATLIYGIATNNMADIMPYIKKNYYQTKLSKLDDQKLDEAKLDATLPVGTTIADNPAIRFIEAGIDLNSIINYKTGKTMAEELGVSLNTSNINLDNIAEQNKILKDLILDKGEYKNPQAYLNNFVKLSSKTNASKVNNSNAPLNVKFSKNVTNQEALDNLSNIDKALSIARNPDAPVKKIRVFDFDDTLATTKSNVLYTMPDGKTGSLTATEFAKKAGEMEAEGAEWDFSEFSKVMKGAKGPLLDVAKFISDAKGERDIFVLTARPQDAAGPIKEFLDSMGLNIPLENITGLGDGTAQAKARWMVDKAAEGYNDFYFADDASKNVKAVKDALSPLDVKSKIQQAKVRYSVLSNEFNDIIEKNTGIEAFKEYSAAKAKTVGASKGNFKFWIPPSAEDFLGLIYPILGKGKVGDKQMAWFKQNTIRPYTKAMESLSKDRINLMSDFKQLKKQLKVPKRLREKNKSGFTNQQAVRVYLWDQEGFTIPGLSKTDLNDIKKAIESDKELKAFADQIKLILKGDSYSKPTQNWLSGTITTDLLDALKNNKRPKYLQQWQNNVDAIFSEANLNKLEALHGSKYREALENTLARMKAGSNRIEAGSRLSNQILDYINGSVGAIMFFNTRSAILQTISSINFINWSFNNPYKAGKALANQRQYWKDFSKLMNSDYLIDRRNGQKIDINESEITNAAATSKNKAKAAISYLLQKGFLPTQIADSFAIASGGATFYRNRINDLVKNQDMSETDAEAQALLEFREIAEESQQSSDPSKISQQQSSVLGRLILAFQNTPMQYGRLTKRAYQDLINGRGDAKSNISKIIYYTFVQNMIFNMLQQAVFALGFGDDDEDDDKKEAKYIKVANGMLDSQLRGLGVGGAAVSVIKNFLMDIYERSGKDRPEYVDSVWKLMQFSPPISSKISKLKQAAWAFDSKARREEIYEKGFSVDNPAYKSLSKVVSATTNVPLDRLYSKGENIQAALSDESDWWQKVAMLSGWPEWSIMDKSSKTKKKTKIKKKKLIFN